MNKLKDTFSKYGEVINMHTQVCTVYSLCTVDDTHTYVYSTLSLLYVIPIILYAYKFLREVYFANIPHLTIFEILIL